MTARTEPVVSAARERNRLSVLLEERAAALRSPLAHNGVYMRDLEADIRTSRVALVGAAVTELATLRAAFDGRLQG